MDNKSKTNQQNSQTSKEDAVKQEMNVTPQKSDRMMKMKKKKSKMSRTGMFM
jgi:hypothetical protein